MPSTSGEHSDDDEQVATAQSLSATRKKRDGKRNLRHGGPLKLGLPTCTPSRSKGSNSSNDEQQLLQQCQAIYSKLPKRSRYAQHKLKCLSKAMELLERGRCGCAHMLKLCACCSLCICCLAAAWMHCPAAQPKPALHRPYNIVSHSAGRLQMYLHHTLRYSASAVSAD
jgi:hypothetical protein